MRDMLVYSKLGPQNQRIPCKVYGRTVRREKGEKGRITQVIILNRRNCVHLIFCAQCGKRYVGETKKLNTTRMSMYEIMHGEIRGTWERAHCSTLCNRWSGEPESMGTETQP